PSTTSNAVSARRCTFWLRFICSCGWTCSLNTCGAPGDSKDTSFTYTFSTVNTGEFGAAALPAAGAAPPLLASCSDIGCCSSAESRKKRDYRTPAGSGPAFRERQPGLLPGADAAVEHEHALEAGPGEALGGATGGLAGLAHQHHGQALRRCQLLRLGVELAHLHVLRAGDVALLEVADRAQVHH